MNNKFTIQELVLKLHSYLCINNDTIKFIFHYQEKPLSLETIKEYIEDYYLDNTIIINITLISK